ncbi:E3 ubiquitin-protein ligase SINAT2-like [Dendroctonus ponderosae]
MNLDRRTYEIYVNRNLDIVQKMITPITKKEYELEQQIAKEYDCPVCFQPTQPPIMMCSNSHIICLNCWKQCIKCPTCRTPKTFTRAFALERLHPLISFPCSFEGCSYTATASHTGIHEHFCPYFPVRCPLGDAYECQWEGNMKTLQNHLKECHPDNVFFTSHVVFRSRLFKRSHIKSYNIIFVVNGRIFKLDWGYDLLKSPKVRFRMVAIGNGNPIVMYNFTLVVAHSFPIDVWSKSFKLYTSHVKQSSNNYSVMNRREDEQVQYNFDEFFGRLVPFCDNNDLLYSVNIEVSHISMSHRNFRI